MSAEQPDSRRTVRLDGLKALQRRLSVAGVPCRIRQMVNGAPTEPGDYWIPVLELGGGWRQCKILYWDGRPAYSYPYIFSRQPVDEDGTDRLASRIVVDYREAVARGDIDERGM